MANDRIESRPKPSCPRGQGPPAQSSAMLGMTEGDVQNGVIPGGLVLYMFDDDLVKR